MRCWPCWWHWGFRSAPTMSMTTPTANGGPMTSGRGRPRLVAGKAATVEQVKIAALIAFGIAGVAGLILALERDVVVRADRSAVRRRPDGPNRGLPTLRILGIRRAVRLRLLRVGRHGGIGLRAARAVRHLVGSLSATGTSTSGNCAVGRRSGGAAGGGSFPGQQPARHRDRQGLGQADAGCTPRAGTRRPLLRLHAHGRGAVHRWMQHYRGWSLLALLAMPLAIYPVRWL